MRNRTNFIYTILIFLIAIISLVTDFYRVLSIGLFILLLLMIINKMGKGIVLRESTAALYTLTCLVMPLIGYIYYPNTNRLARLWVKFMPVPEDVYFGFALPAIAFFCLAITFPVVNNETNDEGSSLRNYLLRCKEVLSNKPQLGLYIMGTGLFFGAITRFLPGGLQFFSTLFFFGSFAGLLYVYFAPPFRYKKLYIIGFFVFVIMNALGSGMFTIVAYMGITIFSFFLLNSNPPFLKKLVIVIAAVSCLIILQNTKGAYRKMIWRSNYQGSSVVLFGKLFVQNLKTEGLFDRQSFFPMYVRLNQGYNIALVMRRIPRQQRHDGGTYLLKVFASAFVPRFLWSDKPEAGGKFNMKYYAGITLRGSWSTNIGPVGEAYGSFGVGGGIIYLFFLGLFIRWAYGKLFSIARKIPLLLCWIPVLFFQTTYSGETDTLQIMNSLLKSAFFIFLIYKLLPVWFGMDKHGPQPLSGPKPVNI